MHYFKFKNSNDWTPLKIAVLAEKNRAIKLLVNSGVDVNAQDNEGNTVLEMASDNDNKEMVELLVANGADIKI